MDKLHSAKSVNAVENARNNESDLSAPAVSFEDAWPFVIKVGVAAHKYGSTATRIEWFLVFVVALTITVGISIGHTIIRPEKIMKY